MNFLTYQNGCIKYYYLLVIAFNFFILFNYAKLKLRIIKKICIRPIKTVSRKIDFTAYGLHRDHPQALGSLRKKSIFRFRNIGTVSTT